VPDLPLLEALNAIVWEDAGVPETLARLRLTV
jgi:hypothetical protein